MIASEGQIIGGKYRLVRELGAGGMGKVFEAVHEEIGNRVAIKLLRPELAEEEEHLTRFKLEARAAGAIGHHGIITIFDFGIVEKTPYLVMEYLKGKNLNEILNRDTRLDVPLACYVTCQVLSALEAVHRKDIVHRDLKPENIFLVDQGAPLPAVKLLDFGISRVAGPLRRDGKITRLTKTGALLGTPFYMSPEQARGEVDLDGRADLYAVGAVLYEALTGKPPFEADNYNSLLVKILTTDPVPPSIAREDVDEELEQAILKALTKDPTERYQSAGEMAADLIGFVDEAAAAHVALELSSPPLSTDSLAPTVSRETADEEDGASNSSSDLFAAETKASSDALPQPSSVDHHSDGLSSEPLPVKSKGPLYGLIAALFIVGLAAVTLLIMSADPAAGRDAPANTLTGNPEESPTPSTGAVTSESSPEEIAAGFVAATTADDDAGPTTTDADVGANDGSETQAERAPSEAPSPNRAAELAGQERRRVAHPAREPRAASADSNNSDRAPVKTIHQGRRGATIITTYDDED